MVRALRFVGVALVVAAGCAEPPRPPSTPPPSAPAASFQADIDTLEAIADALHPGLTRYHTAAEVHQLFATARARVAGATSLPAMFLELTRLTAALRCGHTHPNFANQSKAVVAAVLHAKRLPLLFRWIDGAMVVTDDLQPRSTLARGTQIVAIGGRPTSAVLADLLPLARADGGNDAKRRAYLEDRGDGPIEAFDVLASLAYPSLFAADTATLDVVAPDGARATIAVPLMTFEDHARAVLAARPAPPADGPLWTERRLDRDGKRIVYLPMPTWVAYKTTWDWKADLDRVARTLVDDHVDALVVDLRGNEGGSDVGDALLAHLVDRPLVPRTLSRRVRFTSVPKALRPYLDTWDPSFFELGAAARALGDGWFELPPPDDAAIAPKAPRFTGALVVLVDAANSSATFQFAQTVRDQHLGVLVGTPTGGSQRGINGGAFFFATLPHSGIEVDIPLIGTFPVSTAVADDKGLDPDVLVAPTARAIAEGRDPALDAALTVAARGAPR